MIIKFIKKIFVILSIVFIILNIVGFFLDIHVRNSSIFKVNIIFNKELAKNIILGSSRALTGVNTELLSNATKRKWFNLAMDDTRNETHLLFLELLNDLNKTPDNLVVQYDQENLIKDTTTFFDNDYQILPFINSNKIVSNYFRPKKNYYLFKFCPIYKYIYFNTELLFPSIILFFKPNYNHRFDIRFGDYNYPKDFILQKDENKIKRKTIVLKNKVLTEFYKISHSRKINLIIYTAPIYKTNVNLDTSLNNYVNLSSLFKSMSKFGDVIHINGRSKNEFTDSLVNSLSPILR
jgi:hypothetical protein